MEYEKKIMRPKDWEKMPMSRKTCFLPKTTGKNKLLTFTEKLRLLPCSAPA
ncbi:hypothetical protein ACWA1F_04765 [Flavobacterium sp. 3-218]